MKLPNLISQERSKNSFLTHPQMHHNHNASPNAALCTSTGSANAETCAWWKFTVETSAVSCWWWRWRWWTSGARWRWKKKKVPEEEQTVPIQVNFLSDPGKPGVRSLVSNFLDKSKLGVNNLQSNVAGYQNCSAAEPAGRKNQNRLENNSRFNSSFSKKKATCCQDHKSGNTLPRKHSLQETLSPGNTLSRKHSPPHSHSRSTHSRSGAGSSTKLQERKLPHVSL